MSMAESPRFDPSRVGVATTTQYVEWRYNSPDRKESQVRGNLARHMLFLAKDLGAQTLVIDSELSSPYFRSEIKGLDVPIVERTIKTLSGQRREAIEQMREEDVDVILLNDPEKISVVDNLEACAIPILSGEADIVIPERETELFKKTYPASQYDYETKQNRIINEALKKAGLPHGYDWLIGVRFMANRPEVTDLFLKEYRYTDAKVSEKEDLSRLLNLELWPNGQYIPVVEALMRGFKVKSVRIPYEHPSSQTKFEEERDEEFTAKRKMQTKNIVVGTVQGIKYHQNDPRVLIEAVV